MTFMVLIGLIKRKTKLFRILCRYQYDYCYRLTYKVLAKRYPRLLVTILTYRNITTNKVH